MLKVGQKVKFSGCPENSTCYDCRDFSGCAERYTRDDNYLYGVITNIDDLVFVKLENANTTFHTLEECVICIDKFEKRKQRMLNA